MRLRVKVKYLATAREITGTREETVETKNPSTIMDLLRLLVEKHGQRMRDYLFDPASGEPHSHIRFLLDGKSVHMINAFDTALSEDAILLIVPPVAGG